MILHRFQILPSFFYDTAKFYNIENSMSNKNAPPV